MWKSLNRVLAVIVGGGVGELTVAVLLLQATQGVCCSPSASAVCPSCCSTSSIRLPSTASWQGTPSPRTSTVSAAFVALSLKSLTLDAYLTNMFVWMKHNCQLDYVNRQLFFFSIRGVLDIYEDGWNGWWV